MRTDTIEPFFTIPIPDPSFYIYDHLGNTRIVYHTDDMGASCSYSYVVETLLDYYPYGKTLRSYSLADPERYVTTQHERDEETGYDYRGARYYDPDLFVFLSVDPMAEKYAGWSPYNYGVDNPIRFVDPDGMDVDDIVYYNSNAEEVYRIQSNTEFRVFIQSSTNAAHPQVNPNTGWTEVPMPNIIQERTETGEATTSPIYQANDYIIAARTGLFNQAKNNGNLQLFTTGGDAIPTQEASKITDLDPTFVKSVAIQESHAGITQNDILTANNSGDWDDTYTIKSAYGLSKNTKLNASESLYYGIRILASNSLPVVSYDKNTGSKTYKFIGWGNGAEKYNGGGAAYYKQNVLTQYYNAIKPTVSNY